MSQKVIVQLLDDLDDQQLADETVSFGLDGVTYEIDLTDAHARELREVMSRFTQRGRRVGGRRRTSGGGGAVGSSAAHKERVRQIREWGRANGYKVSDRGRVPQSLEQAYESTH